MPQIHGDHFQQDGELDHIAGAYFPEFRDAADCVPAIQVHDRYRHLNNTIYPGERRRIRGQVALEMGAAAAGNGGVLLAVSAAVAGKGGVSLEMGGAVAGNGGVSLEVGGAAASDGGVLLAVGAAAAGNGDVSLEVGGAAASNGGVSLEVGMIIILLLLDRPTRIRPDLHFLCLLFKIPNYASGTR